MHDVFKTDQQTFGQGYLVTASYVLGHYGSLQVVKFGKLRLDPDRSKRDINYTASGVRAMWRGLQEPHNMAEDYRQKQPYDRVSGLYLPYSFDDLDILPISNGSRFLSMTAKRTRGEGGNYSGLISKVHIQEAMVLTGSHEPGVYLSGFLVKLGTPQPDAAMVVDDILAKLDQE